MFMKKRILFSMLTLAMISMLGVCLTSCSDENDSSSSSNVLVGTWTHKVESTVDSHTDTYRTTISFYSNKTGSLSQYDHFWDKRNKKYVTIKGSNNFNYTIIGDGKLDYGVVKLSFTSATDDAPYSKGSSTSYTYTVGKGTLTLDNTVYTK